MTKALGEYVSPLIADMYQTALNLFPARTLEEMRVVIKEDSGDFRGGEGEQDGEKVPMIVIGMQETLASPNLIARMSSRLGIPRASTLKMKGLVAVLLGWWHFAMSWAT